MEKEKHKIIVPPKYPANYLEHATGPISIRMTNDYLFRAMLQINNKVLKGLISALLHVPIELILSVEIRNPIELGNTLEDKEFFLDILVELNNHSLINLELQVINEHDWTERSLSYLCRTFDNLAEGDSYTKVKPVVHIGILDFTLFPEYPEFYATYKFMNVKNHRIYSDKLALSVLDLTCIDLATEEDKTFEIDHWATLFKATTWEEIKMLAANNEYIQEASNTVYQLSQEESIYWQCRAREDYYRRQVHIQQRFAQLEKETAKVEEARQKAEEARRKAEEARWEAEEARQKAEKARRKAEDEKRKAEDEKRKVEEDAKQREKEAEQQIAALQAELARLKEQL